MRNKMKAWRRMAAAVKRAWVKSGAAVLEGDRFGRSVRVVPAAPQWRGGPVPTLFPSVLLSGLVKRQAWL